MRLVLIAVVSLVALTCVKSQGDSCNTHNNLRGVCIELPSCESLIQLYRDDRSQRTIDILVANQQNCGNRKVGRNPLMCCSDGVQQSTPPPPAPQELNARGPACSTPDNLNGFCINVKECPAVLDEFLKRRNDPEYVRFIQQSNANCNYERQAICCPNQSPPPSQNQQNNQQQTSSNTASRLAEPDQCGVSKVPHNRVVGGVPAKKGGWPWMALIGYKNQLGEVGFKCGGSIISNRHILTAAHCIRSDLAVVRLGEHDLNSETETQHIDFQVKEMIKHPQYDKKDGHNDMAILVLDRPIQFTTLISPICIPLSEPEKSRDFVGYTPFAAGWGRTQEGGKSANVLQEIQLPVVSNSECKASYAAISKVASEKQFDNAVICAGYKEGGRDTCNGDSGGPLMFPLQKNGQYYYYQIGVVSYGIGCARAQVPGVYARVQTFTDWIQRTVETT